MGGFDFPEGIRSWYDLPPSKRPKREKTKKEKQLIWEHVSGDRMTWTTTVMEGEDYALSKRRLHRFPISFVFGDYLVFDIDGNEDIRRRIEGVIQCDKCPDLIQVVLKKGSEEAIVLELKDAYERFLEDETIRGRGMIPSEAYTISGKSLPFPDMIILRSITPRLIVVPGVKHEVALTKKELKIFLPSDDYITVERQIEVEVAVNEPWNIQRMYGSSIEKEWMNSWTTAYVNGPEIDIRP